MDCLMKAILAGIAGVLLLTSMVGSVDAANVPDWVKNNAGWWADGIIDDESFMSGIEYLVKEEIIQID